MEKICRNCLSHNIKFGTSGIYAPFFLKRVFNIDLINLGVMLHVNQNNQLITNFQNNGLESILNFQSPALTSIRVCSDCGFVGPDMYFSADQLQPLYQDYRMESYNQERVRYEPHYQQIQHLVGKDPKEIQERLTHVDNLLHEHVNLAEIHNVLDWGGGEGRFIPQCLSQKEVFILDVSDEPLIHQHFKRISKPDLGISFDFIQVCHVLEHVSSPHEFLKEVLQHLKPGGVIYIEVPQDQSDENLAKFYADPNSNNHIIHEHLNLFSENALNGLGAKLNLQAIKITKKEVDLGWTRGTNLGGLFTAKD